MFRSAKLVYNCPSDSCPLRPFAAVRAGLGCTIRLHGCRYCNFNHVVAIAEEPGGKLRPVAQWSYSQEAGMYLLAAEHGPNPPGWLDAIANALPQRSLPCPTPSTAGPSPPSPPGSSSAPHPT
ncbi:MAG TPA: hypothetical protein VKE74_21960 [Gemmataceae bacterium]|nr:hypothetical protein [Gemmataceae bacterium]